MAVLAGGDGMSDPDRFETVSVPWVVGDGEYHATVDYDKRVFRLGNGITGGPHVIQFPTRTGRKWRSQLREDAISFLIGLDS